MVTNLAASETQHDIPNTFQQTPCSNHPGIASIRESHEDGSRSYLTIALEGDIEDQTFKYCLQFLYTGK